MPVLQDQITFSLNYWNIQKSRSFLLCIPSGSLVECQLSGASEFISPYKGKGARAACSNYRRILILSVPGKIFAHILLARLHPLLTAVDSHSSPALTGLIHDWCYPRFALPVWAPSRIQSASARRIYWHQICLCFRRPSRIMEGSPCNWSSIISCSGNWRSLPDHPFKSPCQWNSCY